MTFNSIAITIGVIALMFIFGWVASKIHGRRQQKKDDALWLQRKWDLKHELAADSIRALDHCIAAGWKEEDLRVESPLLQRTDNVMTDGAPLGPYGAYLAKKEAFSEDMSKRREYPVPPPNERFRKGA